MLNRAEFEAGQRGRPDIADKIHVAHQDLAPVLREIYGMDDIPLTSTVTRISQTRLERVAVEPFTRADLEKVVPGQADRYIALGFHTEVYPDLEEEEAKARYRADFILPQDAAQPAEYAGDLDIISVIEPRIRLARKHELAARLKELDLDEVARLWTTSQVREWIDTDKIKDLTEHPTDMPYLVFTHDGERYRPVTVTQALKLFKSYEVGKPQLEVTDLFLQEPSFYVGRGQDAAGSRDGRGDVPFLDAFNDRPNVGASSADVQPQYWGAASRGKVYVRLGTR